MPPDDLDWIHEQRIARYRAAYEERYPEEQRDPVPD